MGGDQGSVHFVSIQQVLAYIGAHYPGVEFPADSARVYALQLGGLDLDLLGAAVDRCVRRERFFPSVAAILEAVTEVRGESSGQRSGASEWEWVLRWIGASGKGREQEGHELAEAAVQLIGGWSHLGQGQIEHRAHRRREFLEVYAELESGARRLPGRIERRYLEHRGMVQLNGVEVGHALPERAS